MDSKIYKIGYKLFRKRKDGTYGPLFCNRKQKLELNRWYDAEEHPTKGLKFRPGWHVLTRPEAPHLTTRGRVWCKVQCEVRESIQRPKSQGGEWWLCNKMKILEELPNV